MFSVRDILSCTVRISNRRSILKGALNATEIYSYQFTVVNNQLNIERDSIYSLSFATVILSFNLSNKIVVFFVGVRLASGVWFVGSWLSS